MRLKETVEDEASGSLKTPSCKKPRLADKVMNQIALTPPAIVGDQTVP